MGDPIGGELALVRRTARRFLSDRAPIARTRNEYEADALMDRELWREMGSLGWLTLLADGDEIGIRALGAIAEELGAVVCDQPVLMANIVSRAVARLGSADQRDLYLTPLAAGELIATTDLGAADDVALEATPIANGIRLRGEVIVERGDEADVILVTSKLADGRIARLLVPARTAGVCATRLSPLDFGRRYARLSFDDVTLDPGDLLGDPGDDEGDMRLATALICAESLGAAAKAFDITLAYMRTRVVFGRILGSYQVIKHRLTDMSLWLETSRAVTEAAVDALAVGDPAAVELTRVAKAYVSEKAPFVARDCVQLHGSIGFTWEHDIHLYLRRIEANALILGDVDEHLRGIADLVMARAEAVP